MELGQWGGVGVGRSRVVEGRIMQMLEETLRDKGPYDVEVTIL